MIGAAPCPQACLEKHNQVHQEIGDEVNSTIVAMCQIHQQTNCQLPHSTQLLWKRFEGINKGGLKKTVTVEDSYTISKETTHCNLLHVTGGGHLTDDDVFLVMKKKMLRLKL